MKNQPLYKVFFSQQTTRINRYRALINLGMYHDELTKNLESALDYYLDEHYYKNTHLYRASKSIHTLFWRLVIDNRPQQTEDEARQILRQMRQSQIQKTVFCSFIWHKRINHQIELPRLKELIFPVWESYYWGTNSYSAIVQKECTYHEFTEICSLLADSNLVPDSTKIHS